MDYETPESARREIDWWKIGPRIFFVLLVIGLYFSVSLIVTSTNNMNRKAAAPMIAHKERITAAVKEFKPAPEWTQKISDVRFARQCEVWGGYYDCNMYEGVWEMNAPYSKEAADDAVRRFGGVPSDSDMSLATPEPDTVNFLPVRVKVDGVDFEITITNSGEGTNAIVTVTTRKPHGL